MARRRYVRFLEAAGPWYPAMANVPVRPRCTRLSLHSRPWWATHLASGHCRMGQKAQDAPAAAGSEVASGGISYFPVLARFRVRRSDAARAPWAATPPPRRRAAWWTHGVVSWKFSLARSGHAQVWLDWTLAHSLKARVMASQQKGCRRRGGYHGSGAEWRDLRDGA